MAERNRVSPRGRRRAAIGEAAARRAAARTHRATTTPATRAVCRATSMRSQRGSSAMAVELSPNFALWEFIQTDVREAAPLRGIPALRAVRDHAARALSRALSRRGRHVRAHRGERRLSLAASRAERERDAAQLGHGGERLSRRRHRISTIAKRSSASPRSRARRCPARGRVPSAQHRGETDDHLHIDFGFVALDAARRSGRSPRTSTPSGERHDDARRAQSRRRARDSATRRPRRARRRRTRGGVRRRARRRIRRSPRTSSAVRRRSSARR